MALCLQHLAAKPGPYLPTHHCRVAQVDYVSEVLKSYSVIQENQWNKGEM